MVLAWAWLLAVHSAPAEIIPEARRVTWNGNAGVPGGIPNRTTIYTTLSPGATTAQIATAIADCPSGQVVFLSAGTYNNIGAINLLTNSGITLRGAGTGQTIINSVASASYCITTDQYGYAGAADISSGYTKGSTSVTLSAAPNAQVAVGKLIRFDQDDESGLVFQTNGPGRILKFYARVTSISGNTVNFEPALPYTLTAALTPKLAYLNGGPGLSLTGIEDLTINNTGLAANIIELWDSDRCWVKNVELNQLVDAGVFVVNGLQNEVRHCHVHDVYLYPLSPDGYGVYLYGGSWGLVEDNIFRKLAAGVMQSFGTANAYLFNYARETTFQGWAHQTGGFNSNHGAHPMMILWEGNISEQFQSDGYHGSASHQTLFRNWFHGVAETGATSNRKMISLERGSYYHNIVGNVLGSASWSGPGTFLYEMTGEPGYNQQSVIYRLGYPNVANNMLAETVDNAWKDTYTINYPDSQVAATLIRHGNYDYKNAAIVWDASNPDHAVPASLYYSSKPAYFGNRPWPAFDHENPGAAAVTNIPAGYRYVNGVDPPSAGGDQTSPTAPANVAASAAGSAQINVSWAASTDNVGVTGYRVERSQGVGSTSFSQVATLSGTGFNDTGLIASTVYNYRVRAADAAGNLSGYSAVATGTTALPPDITAPTVPATLSAGAVGTGEVTLSWVGSTDNVGVTGYGVERSQGAGSTTFTQVATSTLTSFSDTGLTAATTYNYRVRASDAAGNLSGFSSVATVTLGESAPLPGLVAAYGFEESGGASVADASGNGNTGTISGASRTTHGKFGRALSFNGVDNVVVVNDSASLDLSTAMTLEAWVYPTASQSGWRTILHKETDAWYLHSCNPAAAMHPAGGAIFDGGEKYIGGVSALPLNTWTHLATTYDGTTLRLYVNGNLSATRLLVGVIEVNSTPLRIGGNTHPDQFFQGRVDEIRVYSRALSETEVQKDMTLAIKAPKAPKGFRLVGQ